MTTVDTMRAELRALRYVEQRYRVESEIPIMHAGTRMTTDTNSRIAWLQRQIAETCDDAACGLEQDIAVALEHEERRTASIRNGDGAVYR